MGDINKITNVLLDFGETIEPKELFPTVVPEAQEFVLSNPYGFALAICLDRQTLADIIWTIPYDINKKLGHLDPQKLVQLTENELAKLFSELPRKPRFVNDAPRTVKELTEIVVNYFDGNASNIWVGKNAFEVKNTFRSVFGVGSAIANISVLLIEKAYKIDFTDLDRKNMDIKADIHTIRVLYRLGISGEKTDISAIEATRKMNPNYPGKLDAPLWIIGRKWCGSQNPVCLDCPMNKVCERELRW